MSCIDWLLANPVTRDKAFTTALVRDSSGRLVLLHLTYEGWRELAAEMEALRPRRYARYFD